MNASSIFGDDEESVVYATAYGQGITALFRFSQDSSQPSETLANRIVACYHDHEVDTPGSTFPDRQTMRDELWAAVSSIWNDCAAHLTKRARVDNVVDVNTNETGLVEYKINPHPLFKQYVCALEDVERSEQLTLSADTVDFADLKRLENLGRKGSSTKVLINPQYDKFHVFKGISFETFLLFYEVGNPKSATRVIQEWYNAARTVERLLRCKRIMQPPLFYVTVTDPETNKTAICGSLHEYYVKGDLGKVIEDANTAEQRLPLSLKVKWCSQIAEAVAHTHLVAHTYHMDIKPGNFLIDDEDDLVLIDWEQSDAPATTLAPEADGTWDVHEVEIPKGAEDDRQRSLFYTKYDGPGRSNTGDEDRGPKSWHQWNVFPLWLAECPRAIELAEVLASGERCGCCFANQSWTLTMSKIPTTC